MLVPLSLEANIGVFAFSDGKFQSLNLTSVLLFSNSKTLIGSTLGIASLNCNSPGWIQTRWKLGIGWEAGEEKGTASCLVMGV